MSFFKEFYDWSEVWATLIPISVFVIKKPKEKYLTLILIYLIIALCLNAFADIIWKFKPYMPFYLQDNNFLYNINSVCRLTLLLFFFKMISLNPFQIKTHYFFLITGLVVLINCFFESFIDFSSFIFTCESIILLIYSINYFLFYIKSDEINPEVTTLFIVTGTAIYEASNFFIFLFHKALTLENSDFSAAIWKLSNLYYIILCLYFARAFYGDFKKLLLPVTLF